MSSNRRPNNNNTAPPQPTTAAANPADAKNYEELKAELEETKRNRNYYQLERDRINSFWDITKKEVENLKGEVRNMQREMEENEERHQVELKVYKQKVRHLLYEQKITIDRLKIESENALKIQADEFRQKLAQLKSDKRKLKRELHSMEIAYQEEIKGLKTNQDKNLTKQTETFARKLKETQLKYEMKMKKLREDLELRGRKETEEIEERKNTHIKQLMEKHKLAFQQMKDYYITITRNNLELIKTLKDEAALMKQEEADNEKLMLEIAQDNKRLSEPLVKALAEVKKLRNELANYQKDKLSLKNAKSRLVMMEDQLKKLKWEHEILEQSHKQVHRERDDLYDKFEKTIHEVQQKTLFKNQVLETKVYALQETLEKKDAQIHEILKACNIDEHTAEEISEGLDNVIEEKNNTIRELKFEIEKMKKSYNDLIRVINAKMQQYGIEDELGIEPIANVVDEGVPGRVWVK
ncbi:hypothetical protein NAEGRDRAFT_88226 [Naegleria gruberi]|uniref:Growth arrest-specific protein 8 domain-containing protein n=1 Tax=Naegleria gruberi TaxID=5762 RepID=D2UYG1_NAEGR|nr:uncharacterized protein NAEGRDRAFT_88226 [Naegleria gruberi]EFC50469.1 hypothetical protein NAEGRDRAFT_88226 [Naegleria gruberi]|eukprot:XP_002683213.1 hypothetical protein NAEGRDRAFT_88226 [Naegleria gruberi strain NEG-M]